MLSPGWRYVNVRRSFTFIEESIDEGTQWVVFEPKQSLSRASLPIHYR
jgi:phage tail sheath protein FI